MKAIEFYGRTIKLDDISFCEKRETRVLSFFNIVGVIIFWIITIIFGFFLYQSDMEGKEIFIAILVFLLIMGAIGAIFEFLFTGNSIVVITLHSGDKIKSPAISNEKASSLYKYISKNIGR